MVDASLLIPSSQLEDHHYGFFSLFHGKDFRLKLPELYCARCCGSNWGWWIMVGNTRSIFLINPFIGVSIPLPHQSTLPAIVQVFSLKVAEQRPYYIRKAMLFSASPVATATKNNNLNDCIVVVIYCTYGLAFCRPGDEAWTAIAFDYGPSCKYFEDVIFYDGKLYAINITYDLILVELFPYPKETNCNIARPTEEPEDHNISDRPEKAVYLVESLGELLMVVRYFYKTAMFKIFKLDSQGRCWMKVEDLGDQILFLGISTSFSLSALEYPQFRGNCIYFTHEYSQNVKSLVFGAIARYDLGVLYLENNSIYFCYSHCSLSPPIWFTPISW